MGAFATVMGAYKNSPEGLRAPDSGCGGRVCGSPITTRQVGQLLECHLDAARRVKLLSTAFPWVHLPRPTTNTKQQTTDNKPHTAITTFAEMMQATIHDHYSTRCGVHVELSSSAAYRFARGGTAHRSLLLKGVSALPEIAQIYSIFIFK